MSRMLGPREVLEGALGGAYLGGGGGGLPSEGRRLGELAVATGTPRLVGIEELDPEGVVLTVSAVGAPASQRTAVNAVDYVRAVELFVEASGARPTALNTNENGGLATLNGWLQSACLGIPVVDAPCNGRAHPTGLMGSLGLHRISEYVSHQTAVGGEAGRGGRVELAVRGSLAKCAALVRYAAVQAGGLVAVARNPVPAAYLAEHAACGAITQAIDLGRIALKALPEERAEKVALFLGGTVVAGGAVGRFELDTREGFDAGTLTVDSDQVQLELSFWNEFITVEARGRRLATFPDLIVTVDREGLPLTSAELRPGTEVQVITAPAQSLHLGAGMRDPALFRPVEQATGKQVIGHAFGGG